MAGDEKLLRCGIPLRVRRAEDLTLGPFKFLETCRDPCQDELDLLWGKVKLRNDIFIPGTVGIVLDGDLDQGMCLTVIFLIFSLCVELRIVCKCGKTQMVVDSDQLPVGLDLADLRRDI